MKRLRKCEPWLHALCREPGVGLAARDCPQLRAFDTATVHEPGSTGSVRMPT